MKSFLSKFFVLSAILVVLFVLFLWLTLWKFTLIPPLSKVVVDSGESFDRDEKLQADADSLLPLFDNMPPVSVYLKDEPIIKSGTNTGRGVAYTDCQAGWIPTIFFKKIFYQNTNKIQLTNILKHELTHAWFCRQKITAGHDERFREKFEQIGGFGN